MARDTTHRPHWLNWRCCYPDCAKNIRIRTRAEEKLTCPHCHRAQDGPAALFRELDELRAARRVEAPKEAPAPIKATKVKVNGQREPTKLAVAATETPPPPTEPAAQPKKPSAFDRMLFRL
jgi:hypothetical protein